MAEKTGEDGGRELTHCFVVVVRAEGADHADDTSTADLVVSIGCDLNNLPAAEKLQEWDVPMLSSDFDASVLAIHERAEGLAAELASE